MVSRTLSRRQFLGGTAAVAAASVLPVISATDEAIAIPEVKFPDTTIFGAKPSRPWVPLDSEAAARHGYEIYKGMHTGLNQSG